MTTDILKDWLRDMPIQFIGKKNIEVLIKAFARQMQELDVVFEELNTKTDLDTATGQNLDYVGTIIPLTRKEAGDLAGMGVADSVISDERYRKYLQYMMLRNTSECTYYDIMKSIEILWEIDNVSYYERPDRPATIFIGLPMTDIEDDDPAEGKPDIMKPGGVGFIYAANFDLYVDQSDLERIFLKGLDIYAVLSLNQQQIALMDIAVIVGTDVVNSKERIQNGSVVIKKDLWYLDGEYNLDGKRILDAEIGEEML